jgi:alkanesulfonate monooxygenase SsuD/methylene tetrahydromethanopterin reductase-like flavin-dependent oxidoreductase (luciferase family)
MPAAFLQGRVRITDCRSLNALSGGRFTLGLGLGSREDDYEVSEIETEGRGKRFDAMLERMR